MRYSNRNKSSIMLLAMFLMIVQPFIPGNVVKAKGLSQVPSVQLTTEVDVVNFSHSEVIENATAIGGQGNFKYTAYLNFSSPNTYSYTNAKLRFTNSNCNPIKNSLGK